METLVRAVAEIIRNPDSQQVDETYGSSLTVDEKDALQEAERLADLYAEITPKQSPISGSNLFVFSNDG